MIIHTCAYQYRSISYLAILWFGWWMKPKIPWFLISRGIWSAIFSRRSLIITTIPTTYRELDSQIPTFVSLSLSQFPASVIQHIPLYLALHCVYYWLGSKLQIGFDLCVRANTFLAIGAQCREFLSCWVWVTYIFCCFFRWLVVLAILAS